MKIKPTVDSIRPAEGSASSAIKYGPHGDHYYSTQSRHNSGLSAAGNTEAAASGGEVGLEVTWMCLETLKGRNPTTRKKSVKAWKS